MRFTAFLETRLNPGTRDIKGSGGIGCLYSMTPTARDMPYGRG